MNTIAPAAPSATPIEKIVTDYLQKIPLLSGVDEEALVRLASAVQLISADRGCRVIDKGETGNHLLFLLSGRVQAVDITEDGREIGLSFI
ncbi:MAG: hypothetical protein ACD_10C00268G0001, partial [uncultured bacterium]